MKRWIALLLLPLCALTACAPGGTAAESTPETPTTPPGETTQEATQMEEGTLRLLINGVPVAVAWEENQAVAALIDLARQQPIQVQTSAYGGFEQVGALPGRIPREDVPMDTVPGDIVLYSGDQIVLFFGSNTWRYTKLGHIQGMTQGELAQLLNRESVTVALILDS